MRVKLVPNYSFDPHIEASMQRDNLGIWFTFFKLSYLSSLLGFLTLLIFLRLYIETDKWYVYPIYKINRNLFKYFHSDCNVMILLFYCIFSTCNLANFCFVDILKSGLELYLKLGYHVELICSFVSLFVTCTCRFTCT